MNKINVTWRAIIYFIAPPPSLSLFLSLSLHPLPLPYSALQELYTFRAFVNQMNPKKELRVELERCIEPSVDSWFRWLKAKVMPNNGVRS